MFHRNQKNPLTMQIDHVTSLLKILHWFLISIRVKANHSIMIAKALCHPPKATSLTPLLSHQSFTHSALAVLASSFLPDSQAYVASGSWHLFEHIHLVCFFLMYPHGSFLSFPSCLCASITFYSTCYTKK